MFYTPVIRCTFKQFRQKDENLLGQSLTYSCITTERSFWVLWIFDTSFFDATLRDWRRLPARISSVTEPTSKLHHPKSTIDVKRARKFALFANTQERFDFTQIELLTALEFPRNLERNDQ